MFCRSRGVPPKTPEGTGAWAHVIHAAAQKLRQTANITRFGVCVSPMNEIFSKCHPPHESLFPLFLFRRNKNRDSAKEVRATPEVADAPHLRLLAVRK